jgi:hypothetical protein
MTVATFDRYHTYFAAMVAIIVAVAGMHPGLVRADAAATAAAASPAAAGKADQLFRLGKDKLAQQDYAAACPLLAQSYELDPASGSLLALALCHEREGKLASAYREYGEVAARSKQEQRADREAVARAQATALEPKLSTLTIAVDASLDGLEVRLDGALIEPAHLGKLLPLDGGEHMLIASAPKKQPWSTQLTLAKSADNKTVNVAALQDLPPAAPVAAAPMAPARVRHSQAPREGRDSGMSAGEWIGLGTIGAGLVGLGVGTYFAVRAGNDHDASGTCDGATCTYRQKRDFGDSAALSFVLGGSLAATGVVIYLISRTPSSTESAAATHPWTAAAWAAPHAGGAVMRGQV